MIDTLPASLARRLRLQFHDHRRFWSAELARVFAHVIRAGVLGGKSDVSGPHDAVPPELDAESPLTAIIRGDD